jgi:hypothetical protein
VNPVNTLTHYFLRIHFNIILSAPGSFYLLAEEKKKRNECMLAFNLMPPLAVPVKIDAEK